MPVFILKDNDTTTLWLGAFRYYLGRTTYAVSDFCELLIKNWPDLDVKTQELIKKELQEASIKDSEQRSTSYKWPALGHDCDKVEWDKVLKFILTN